MKKSLRRWWLRGLCFLDGVCAARERGIAHAWRWLGRTFRHERSPERGRRLPSFESLEPRTLPSSAPLLFQAANGLADGSTSLIQSGDGISSAAAALSQEVPAFTALAQDFQLVFGSAAGAAVDLTGSDNSTGTVFAVTLAGANSNPQTAGTGEIDAADGTPQYTQI
jgi:hypothetical protein